MATADIKEIELALSEIDFPASKEAVVRHATTAGANDGVLRALRALPLADYANMAEVLRSADLDPAALEGQTPHDKAQQARSTRTGIAEHMRDVDA